VRIGIGKRLFFKSKSDLLAQREDCIGSRAKREDPRSGGDQSKKSVLGSRAKPAERLGYGRMEPAKRWELSQCLG